MLYPAARLCRSTSCCVVSQSGGEGAVSNSDDVAPNLADSRPRSAGNLWTTCGVQLWSAWADGLARCFAQAQSNCDSDRHWPELEQIRATPMDAARHAVCLWGMPVDQCCAMLYTVLSSISSRIDTPGSLKGDFALGRAKWGIRQHNDGSDVKDCVVDEHCDGPEAEQARLLELLSPTSMLIVEVRPLPVMPNIYNRFNPRRSITRGDVNDATQFLKEHPGSASRSGIP